MSGIAGSHGGDAGDRPLRVTLQPLFFPCGGETLFGICHVPDVPLDVGVVVVVGGPQYRVGSHRLFTLLSQILGERGIASMRFDYRGMGDSTGAMRGFESIGDDIRAAVDAFRQTVPRVRRVVLWGLCDGASAAAFHAAEDARIAGLVLLNPWVRTQAGEANAYLKTYYLHRLVSGAFWRKLLSGEVRPWQSMRSLLETLHAARRVWVPVDVGSGGGPEDLPARVMAALGRFRGEVLFILSGRDIVAQEFETVAVDARYRDVLAAPRFRWYRLAEANHTFSTAVWRTEVADATSAWLERLGSRNGEAAAASLRHAQTR